MAEDVKVWFQDFKKTAGKLKAQAPDGPGDH